MLAYEPYEYMAVKHHIFKVKFLFMLVLVDEGCLELSFLSELELFHLYLLGEIHPILRHPLIDCLLCTPVDCKLLVLLLVFEVVDLLL